jgi:hypothetical protein
MSAVRPGNPMPVCGLKAEMSSLSLGFPASREASFPIFPHCSAEIVPVTGTYQVFIDFR